MAKDQTVDKTELRETDDKEIWDALKMSAFNLKNVSELMVVVNTKLQDLEKAREDHEIRIQHIEDYEQARNIHHASMERVGVLDIQINGNGWFMNQGGCNDKGSNGGGA